MTELNWSNQILQPFRRPGAFRYQVITGETVSTITTAFDTESDWILAFESVVKLSSTSIFGKQYISKVQNGAWLLDGSYAPVCIDNVCDSNLSSIVYRELVNNKATWTISPDILKYYSISDIPLEDGCIRLVWDLKTHNYPQQVTIKGVNYTSETTYDTVWSKSNMNSDIVTTFDVSDITDDYTELLIEAYDWVWDECYLPILTNVYFGRIESNILNKDQVLQVDTSSSSNIYSNELPTSKLTVQLSRINLENTLSENLMLSESLPGNSTIWAQFGQTFEDDCIRFSEPKSWTVSQYTAPSDSREITIEGSDTLALNSDIFEFNYIPMYSTDEGNKLFFNDLLDKMQASTSLTLSGYEYYPDNLYTLNTNTAGALPKDTTVKSTLQYMAQIMQGALYIPKEDYAPDIGCKWFKDFTKVAGATISQECITSDPNITLDTAINKIEVNQYRVCNKVADVSTTIYEGDFPIKATTANTSYFVSWQNPPADKNQKITVTVENKETSTKITKYTVTEQGSTYLRVSVQLASTTNAPSSLHIKVVGCPLQTEFFRTTIQHTTTDPIEIHYSWDNAKRGISAYCEEGILSTFLAGAYHAKIIIIPNDASTPIFLKLLGADVKIEKTTVVYWDVSNKQPGETLTVDNPLVFNMDGVKLVGDMVKKYIQNRKVYQLEYLGDPDITALDTKKVVTDDETVNSMLLTETSISFNGGYSGTIKGCSVS